MKQKQIAQFSGFVRELMRGDRSDQIFVFVMQQTLALAHFVIVTHLFAYYFHYWLWRVRWGHFLPLPVALAHTLVSHNLVPLYSLLLLVSPSPPPSPSSSLTSSHRLNLCSHYCYSRIMTIYLVISIYSPHSMIHSSTLHYFIHNPNNKNRANVGHILIGKW